MDRKTGKTKAEEPIGFQDHATRPTLRVWGEALPRRNPKQLLRTSGVALKPRSKTA